MFATVSLIDLKLFCILGVYPEERISLREIRVDLELRCDISRVVQSDSLEAGALDYALVAFALEQFAKESSFHLIETFAHRALLRCFSLFPVVWGRIKVKKPGAIPTADYAAIELERQP